MILFTSSSNVLRLSSSHLHCWELNPFPGNIINNYLLYLSTEYSIHVKKGFQDTDNKSDSETINLCCLSCFSFFLIARTQSCSLTTRERILNFQISRLRLMICQIYFWTLSDEAERNVFENMQRGKHHWRTRLLTDIIYATFCFQLNDPWREINYSTLIKKF